MQVAVSETVLNSVQREKGMLEDYYRIDWPKEIFIWMVDQAIDPNSLSKRRA
jgi:hypothetical protein